MHSEVLRFALLLSLPGLLLPSPAAAQRWNDLEDALEGRELILRPTFEGRRKVYLDMEDDRLFALHRGERLFRSQTLHIRGANHLPDMADQQPFATESDALTGGYDRCGVCFVPTPDVSDYQTERSLAMMSLQQVQSTFYPLVDTELQEQLEGVGRRVVRQPSPYRRAPRQGE